MSLKIKIFLGFIIILTISIIIGVFGVINTNNLKSHIVEISNENLPKVQKILTIYQLQTSIEKSEMALLGLTDKNLREEEYRRIENSWESINRLINEYELFDLNEDELKYWKDYKEKLKMWETGHASFMEISKKIDETNILDPKTLKLDVKTYESELYRLAWLIEKAILDKEPFDEDLNPRNSPFGKWLENYQTENDYLADMIDEMKKYNEGFLKTAKTINTVVKSKNEKQIELMQRIYNNSIIPNLENIFDTFAIINQIADESLKLKNQMLEQSLNVNLPLFEESASILKTIVEYNKNEAAQKANNTIEKVREAIITILTVIVIGIIIAIIFATLTIRSIVNSINILMKKIQAFGKGDLTVNFKVKGNDEISKMANALEEMANELRSSMKLIHEASNKLSVSSSTLASISEEQNAISEELANQSKIIESNTIDASASVEEVLSGVE